MAGDDAKTGKVPVYRYEFDQTLPLAPDAPAGAQAMAPHASEIEFVFQVLSSRKLPWRPDDRTVSDLMAAYWSNFAKTGDPTAKACPNGRSTLLRPTIRCCTSPPRRRPHPTRIAPAICSSTACTKYTVSEL